MRHKIERSMLRPGITIGEFIEVDGVRLHYIVKGEGPPLLLVHGLGAYSYTWRYNIDELARHFKVYALDLKGFGLSEKPQKGNYSLSSHAKMVARFLDTMGLNSVDYAGSSMGGEIGLRLALQYPERLKKLVLISSSGYRDNLASSLRILAYLMYFPFVRQYIRKKFLQDEILFPIVRQAYYNQEAISDEEVRDCLCPVFLLGTEDAYMALFRQFDFGFEKANYSKIRHQTLIIGGEQDRIIPLTDTKRLHEEIKNSVLITIPDGGHFVHEEKWREVNGYILHFLLGLSD
ncbi:alpha/beta fold hydrolase [Aneurinibacillus tyrosinisolvens]|uniref:alpha/beta fold hydrolase n=1 Tax=Aneurinibacillus tyrosinisolvens TaxID=1443435 RepID=UPI00063F9F6C|nr:alpha/beta hydrolase [Aneurinibacillus tyrosinisolvens]